MLDGTTLDTQGYRPAVVYINGDYWGIFNLREKVTEHQVISHHSLSLGAIDLIEGYGRRYRRRKPREARALQFCSVGRIGPSPPDRSIRTTLQKPDCGSVVWAVSAHPRSLSQETICGSALFPQERNWHLLPTRYRLRALSLTCYFLH